MARKPKTHFVCKDCDETLPREKFPVMPSGWPRRYCHACTYKRESSRKTPEQRAKTKEYMKRYYTKHPEAMKYRALRSSDASRGFKGCLSIEEFREIVLGKECFYCSTSDNLSLDRKNNDVGHTVDNCVPCCSKCNFILGDISFEAKLELKQGLKAAHLKGFLNDWIIPTKRPESKRKKKAK